MGCQWSRYILCTPEANVVNYKAAWSLLEVQDALGHRSASTTRVYVQRVAVKRDRHSEGIGKRLGV